MSVLTDFLELLDGLLGSAAHISPIVLLGAGFSSLSILGSHKSASSSMPGGLIWALRRKRGQVTPVTSSLVDSAVWNRWYRQHWRRGIRYFSGRARCVVLDVGYGFRWHDTKFVEVSISHKYRKQDDQGFMVGGPMHYMEHGLNLKWLAVFFAVATDQFIWLRQYASSEQHGLRHRDLFCHTQLCHGRCFGAVARVRHRWWH